MVSVLLFDTDFLTRLDLALNWFGIGDLIYLSLSNEKYVFLFSSLNKMTNPQAYFAHFLFGLHPLCIHMFVKVHILSVYFFQFLSFLNVHYFEYRFLFSFLFQNCVNVLYVFRPFHLSLWSFHKIHCIGCVLMQHRRHLHLFAMHTHTHRRGHFICSVYRADEIQMLIPIPCL